MDLHFGASKGLNDVVLSVSLLLDGLKLVAFIRKERK